MKFTKAIELAKCISETFKVPFETLELGNYRSLKFIYHSKKIQISPYSSFGLDIQTTFPSMHGGKTLFSKTIFAETLPERVENLKVLLDAELEKEVEEKDFFNANDLLEELKKYPDDMTCQFDFEGGKWLEDFCSWRGSYEFPALIATNDSKNSAKTIKEWIKIVSEIDRGSGHGWKGGEYDFSGDQHLFVTTDWGVSGQTDIFAVELIDGIVTVKTKHHTW